MRRRSSFRNLSKLSGIAFLGLLLAAWAFSMSGWIYYVGDNCLVGLTEGRIDLEWNGALQPGYLDHSWDPKMDHPAFLIRPTLGQLKPGSAHFGYGRVLDRRPFDELFGAGLPAYHKEVFSKYFSRFGTMLGPVARYRAVLPLWVPFVLGASLLTWLIWRDRPAPPGHCRVCRYDLSGSCAHLCPECGTPVPEWLAANVGKA